MVRESCWPPILQRNVGGSLSYVYVACILKLWYGIEVWCRFKKVNVCKITLRESVQNSEPDTGRSLLQKSTVSLPSFMYGAYWEQDGVCGTTRPNRVPFGFRMGWRVWSQHGMCHLTWVSRVGTLIPQVCVFPKPYLMFGHAWFYTIEGEQVSSKIIYEKHLETH